jgi:hypothetical protein
MKTFPNILILFEIEKDTINNDENLIEKLFQSLASEKKPDMEAIYNFLDIYGQKYLSVLPETIQDALRTDSEAIKKMVQKKKQADNDELNSDKYFTVKEVDEPGFINFVDTQKKFNEMCTYFENNKTDVIGYFPPFCIFGINLQIHNLYWQD